MRELMNLTREMNVRENEYIKELNEETGNSLMAT